MKQSGRSIMEEPSLDSIWSINLLLGKEASSSDSTSNLQQLYRIMQEQGIDRAALISSPYHLQRIKHMRILPGVHFSYLPYSPTGCMPPLTRSEIWWSAHYNLAAYVLHLVLPEPVYLRFVDWIRTNTDW